MMTSAFCSGCLEGTRYGESGKIRGGEGPDVWRQGRSRLEAISEQAIALRDRWIDARGAARIGGRAVDSAAISTEPTAERRARMRLPLAANCSGLPASAVLSGGPQIP